MSNEGPENWQERRESMVEYQLRRHGIGNERVLAAMLSVPRHRFVPINHRYAAYDDTVLSLGWGQTISQPYMVAFMLQLLDPQPDNRVLEVGAGSGYQAALLAVLCREVYAIEIVPALAERSRQALQELGYHNVQVINGDGSLGYPPAAPYDRIIIAAASPQITPEWEEQLAEGGRLVAPVGSMGAQRCLLAEKKHSELIITASIGCVFVPLVGEHGWQSDRRV